MTITTIDPTLRVMATPDPKALNPRTEWDTPVGTFTPEPNGIYPAPGPRHEFPADLFGAHHSSLTPDQVVRWARIFHNIRLEWHNDRGGLTYWWVDPAEFDSMYNQRTDTHILWPSAVDSNNDMVYEEVMKDEAERRVISDQRKVYLQWEEGRVMILIVQEKIGGKWVEVVTEDEVYLDEEYTALRAAKPLLWFRPDLQARLEASL